MKIPQADLKAQYAAIKSEVMQAIAGVIENTQFVRGSAVQAFEEKFASYCEVEHAVGVANGTDALMLALRAVGVGEGDEVITSPFTFTATGEAIYWVGAKPVFVDISPANYTINPDKIEEKITAKTKAIIPVHLYGHPCDMESIMQIAQKHDLHVIEDAAQAHGARYNGKRVGSLGHLACFSFYPGKNLGAYGDAGAVVTNNTKIAEKIRRLGDHGSSKKYENDMMGFNSRLDGVQGAVLGVKINYIEAWTARRREIAQYYNDAFANVNAVQSPIESSWAECVYHLYVIQLENRAEVKQKLNEAGIGAAIHYPRPLNLQKSYDYLKQGRGSFPVAEQAGEKVLSLPNYPEMTEQMMAEVVNILKKAIISS